MKIVWVLPPFGVSSSRVFCSARQYPLAQISVTKIAVPKPRYIQKIIDKFVRYLLRKCNNLFVFLSEEYMFICSQ